MIVPEYVPITADDGIAIEIVGFHVTELSPTPPPIENAVRGTSSVRACCAVACPGANAPTPAIAVAGPDQYDTADRLIVSRAVAPPVVKSVEVTVAVHVAFTAPRVSCTITPPRWASSVPAFVGVPADSSLLDGAEMLSVPGGGGAGAVVVVVVVAVVVVVVVSVVVVVPPPPLVVDVVVGASVVVVVVGAVVVVVGSVIVVVGICADAPIAGITRIPAIRAGGMKLRRTATSVGPRPRSG